MEGRADEGDRIAEGDRLGRGARRSRRRRREARSRAHHCEAAILLDLRQTHGFQMRIRSRPTPSRSARCRLTKPRRQLGSHCPATDDSAKMMVAVNASVAIASISEKPATREFEVTRFIFLSLACADGWCQFSVLRPTGTGSTPQCVAESKANRRLPRARRRALNRSASHARRARP